MKLAKNKYGFSLVEVMIVAALLGGLALVVSNITKQQAITQKKTESSFEQISVHNAIIQNLLNTTSCINTLANGTDISVAGYGITSIKNRNNVAIYSTGTTYNYLIKIDSITFPQASKSIPAKPGYGEVVMRMTYSKTSKVIPGAAANAVTTADIPIKVQVNAAGVVINCYSATENAIASGAVTACSNLTGTVDSASNPSRCNLSSFPATTDTNVGVSTRYLTDYMANYLTNTLDPRFVNVTGDTMTGALAISAGGLTVTGNSTFNNNLTISGSATHSGTSTFTGASTFNNSITVNSNNITVNNGYVYTAGSGYFISDNYITISDKRMKNNIENLDDEIDDLLKLQGVRFNWKNSNRHDVGFIAQEVEKIYPDLVYKNPKTGLMGVRYASLIPIVVENIKVLREENKQLKKDNEEIREEIRKIKLMLKRKK